MIHVIATVQIHAGRREAFLKEFHQVVPLVRAEQGCLEYGPTVDVASGVAAQPAVRDDVVVVVEKWESLPALTAHLAAPHMLTYRGKVKDLVAGVELRVLQPA
jgi:quinol monooxygenase YgiN